jgi:hypothetical protein
MTEFTIMLAIAFAAGDPGVPKEPIPDPISQKEAEKEVRKVFKDDYEGSRRMREALAKTLLDRAAETRDRPAMAFILLRESRDVAAGAGDLKGVLEASEALAARFPVDPLATKLKGLEAVPATALDAKGLETLADEVMKISDAAVARDDYDFARSAVDVLAERAKGAGDAFQSDRARDAGKEIGEIEREHGKAKPAFEKLKLDPGNAEAAETAGSFLCFIKGDWDRGLPLLAKSKDETLRALAGKDIAAPQDGAGMAGIGDAWLSHGKRGRGRAREKILGRAAHWYGKALPLLSGLDKARIEKALEEISLDAGPGAPPPIDWAALRPIVQYRYGKKNFASAKFDYSDPDAKKLTDGRTDGNFGPGSVGWREAGSSPIVFDLLKKVSPRKVRIHAFGADQKTVGLPRSIRVSSGTAEAQGALQGKVESGEDATGWIEVPLRKGAASRYFWIELSRSKARYILIDEIEFR